MVVTPESGSSTSSNTANRSLAGEISQNVASNSQNTLNLATNIARNAAELSGRDNVVLLTREVFYRNCEAAANGLISINDYADIHKQSINQISNLLTAREEEAKAKKAEAEAKKAEAEKKRAEILKGAGLFITQIDSKYCAKKHGACMAQAGADKTKQKQCETTILTPCLGK